MNPEDDPTVVEVVREELHPVKFGRPERKILIVILVLGAANLFAALFLIAEALWA